MREWGVDREGLEGTARLLRGALLRFDARRGRRGGRLIGFAVESGERDRGKRALGPAAGAPEAGILSGRCRGGGLGGVGEGGL